MEKKIRIKSRDKSECTIFFFFVMLQIDHLARAKRSKEIPFLEKQYDEESVYNREFWEQQEIARVTL